jgi:1-acyl-sn-glycerol-3-phosphate acyltransferase
VFLSRSWVKDKRSIEQTFAHLREYGLPFWLMTHPEGSRASPEKILKSQEFARSKNLPHLQHLLLPRIKGLKATMAGLRGSLETVLDVTLCWDKPAGPLPFFFYGQGGSRVVHCYLREFKMADIPEDDEAFETWLYARWAEKDQLVDTFKKTGAFDAPVVPVKAPHAEMGKNLRLWKGMTLAVTALWVWWRWL